MADLHDLTALEQGAAVRAKQVSPTELVDHYLQRVARLSDSVGAFVTVTDTQALAQARPRRRPGRGTVACFTYYTCHGTSYRQGAIFDNQALQIIDSDRQNHSRGAHRPRPDASYDEYDRKDEEHQEWPPP